MIIIIRCIVLSTNYKVTLKLSLMNPYQCLLVSLSLEVRHLILRTLTPFVAADLQVTRSAIMM